MVTDRLATAGLLAILGLLYPRSYMAFLGLMFLDIFSHWFQMYATFLNGSDTHKVCPQGLGLALGNRTSVTLTISGIRNRPLSGAATLDSPWGPWFVQIPSFRSALFHDTSSLSLKESPTRPRPSSFFTGCKIHCP